jgi:hypothetical protein
VQVLAGVGSLCCCLCKAEVLVNTSQDLRSQLKTFHASFGLKPTLAANVAGFGGAELRCQG